MPATPERAAAVLSAETDLTVHLHTLLHPPPAPTPAPALHTPLRNASAALIHETHLLLQDASDPHTPPAPLVRDLARLARAILPPLQFLEAVTPTVILTAVSRPLDAARANASAHCLAAVAAFVQLRSGAHATRIAAALVRFLTLCDECGQGEAWGDTAMCAVPEVAMALHMLAEEGEDECRRAIGGGLQGVAWLIQREGGRADVAEVLVSAMAFALLGEGGGGVERAGEVLKVLRREMEGRKRRVCKDLDMLIARLEAHDEGGEYGCESRSGSG